MQPGRGLLDLLGQLLLVRHEPSGQGGIANREDLRREDANGAGEAGRHSVGTAVAGGMFVSTILNVVFIPVLYVIVRTLAPGSRREQLPVETEAAHE